MVQVEKNGIVLFIPKTAYEIDYKNNGWKIVGAKKEDTQAPTQPEVKEVKEEVKEEKTIEKVENSKKKR